MNQLVLLVPPSEMQRNKHQMTLRKLFNNDLQRTTNEVSEFLRSNNIPFSCDIGTNEFGKTMVAFAIEGENLFGLTIDNVMESVCDCIIPDYEDATGTWCKKCNAKIL